MTKQFEGDKDIRKHLDTWIISNRAKGTVAGESVLYIRSKSSSVSLECRMLDGTVDEMS